MPVRFCQKCVDAREFAEWRALEELEDREADAAMAGLGAAAGADGPGGPADVPRREQTGAEMKAKMRLFSKAWNMRQKRRGRKEV